MWCVLSLVVASDILAVEEKPMLSKVRQYHTAGFLIDLFDFSTTPSPVSRVSDAFPLKIYDFFLPESNGHLH